jgi:hypothetical protein
LAKKDPQNIKTITNKSSIHFNTMAAAENKVSSMLMHPFQTGNRLECVAGGVAVGVALGVAFMKWKNCCGAEGDNYGGPKVVFLDNVPSDIDVSQSVTPLPIRIVAQRAGIQENELFP